MTLSYKSVRFKKGLFQNQVEVTNYPFLFATKFKGRDNLISKNTAKLLHKKEFDIWKLRYLELQAVYSPAKKFVIKKFTNKIHENYCLTHVNLNWFGVSIPSAANEINDLNIDDTIDDLV